MDTIDEMKEVTDIPVVVADQDGIITYVNEKFNEGFPYWLWILSDFSLFLQP